MTRAITFYLCLCMSCWGYTDNAGQKLRYTDGTATDVQNAIKDISADGWCVVWPDGVYNISSQILLSNAYNTILCASNRNKTTINASGSTYAVIECVPHDTNHWKRITGFNFTNGASLSGATLSLDAINGGWTNTLRIDHCNFTNIRSSKIISWHSADRNSTMAGPYGLIDNNIFHQDSFVSAVNGIYVYHGVNRSRWAWTTNWGGYRTVCIESNLAFRLGDTVTEGNPFVDGAYAGFSYTLRDNTITNWTKVAHGADSAPTSAMEIENYRNTTAYTDPIVDFDSYYRGGSYRHWSNKVYKASTLNKHIKQANNTYPAEDPCTSYPCFQQLGRSAHDGVESPEICYYWGNTEETITTDAPHVVEGRDFTNSVAVLGYQLGVHPMHALTYNAFVDGAPSDPGVTGNRDRRIARLLLRP